MSTDKTILPASVLISLYKDTLVLPELEKKEPKIMNPGKVIEPLVLTTPPKDTIKETLVEIEVPTTLKQPTTPVEIPDFIANAGTTRNLKFIGEHLKKVAVIIKDDLAVHLNETDFQLLTSILNACKLTIADIALINVAQQKISLHEILEQLPSKLVIIFEVTSTELKIKLPTTLYKPIQLGETYLLFSNSLSIMQGKDDFAKVEKLKLWTVLKQLFQL